MMRQIICWLLLTCIGVPCLAQRNSSSASSSGSGFFSSSSSEKAWNCTEGSPKPLPGGPRPALSELAKLQVEWISVEVDALGNQVTVKGQLLLPTDEADTLTPIEFSQPITVILANKPDAIIEQNWFVEKTAEHKSVKPNVDGTFTATFHTETLQRDPTQIQDFEIAISLATVSKRDRGMGQVVEWTSDDKLLELKNHTVTISPDRDLVEVIRLLNATRYRSDQNFNPAAIILAVNALHPLGKTAALNTLERYLELGRAEDVVRNDMNEVFSILRLLFEPIEVDQHFPVPRNFEWNVYEKEFAKDWPLNPLELVSGIPFKFNGGGMGGSGRPEWPDSHIDFARKRCVLRDEPLIPTLDPILAAQRLCESQKIRQFPSETQEAAISAIRDQAINMLPVQFRRAENRYALIDEETWQQILEDTGTGRFYWRTGQGFVLMNVE